MNPRKEYWEQQIAFDCPILKERHSIDRCFRMCQENSYGYLQDGDRTCGFLYCLLDPQKRFLHNGTIRRDL